MYKTVQGRVDFPDYDRGGRGAVGIELVEFVSSPWDNLHESWCNNAL
jgi:hypothetical protein